MTQPRKRFDLGPPRPADEKRAAKPRPKPPEGAPAEAAPQPPAIPTPQRGLACPRCGCQDFWVVYTRAWNKGRIMRRRECRFCGRRVTTFESA